MSLSAAGVPLERPSAPPSSRSAGFFVLVPSKLPSIFVERNEEPEEGSSHVITPTQCLEARTLLGWSRDRMAARCGVSADTLRGFELGRLVPRPGKLEAIKAALEEIGIEFTNGGGPGVRLRAKGS